MTATIQVTSHKDIVTKIETDTLFEYGDSKVMKKELEASKKDYEIEKKRICEGLEDCDNDYSYTIESIGKTRIKVTTAMNLEGAMTKKDGLNVLFHTKNYNKGDYVSYEKYIGNLASMGYVKQQQEK